MSKKKNDDPTAEVEQKDEIDVPEKEVPPYATHFLYADQETKPYKLEISGLGSHDNELIAKMRTHFLRILSGYLPRYLHTRLHENKWKFATMMFEASKRGHGNIHIHSVVQMFQLDKMLDRFIEQLDSIDQIDRGNRTNVVIFIQLIPYSESQGRAEPKWRRYGMYEGQEVMLHYGDEINDDGEGVLVLLPPDHRKFRLNEYGKFKKSLQDD